MPGYVCVCPITKTLTVSFNTVTPAPVGGYQVGWRLANSNTAYNFKSPVPTTSPVTFTGVPACQDIQVVVQSICANSQVSSETTYNVNAVTNRLCGQTFSGSHSHNGSYTYADYLLNVTSAPGTSISLTYDVVDKPNKFSVYDETGTLVATTGWRGVAGYAGTWGASLNTATTGTLTFNKGSYCYFKLVVESETDVTFTDTWSVTLNCPEFVPANPTITQLSCSGGYGTYRIDGTAGTNVSLSLSASGSLTNSSTSYCAQIQGTMSSSTGQTTSGASAVVSASGSASFGSGDATYINFDIPSSGYAIINTTLFTVNSTASMTSGTLKIFSVNGSATNITQSVCVQNSTGTVSCGAVVSYDLYYANMYSCNDCVAGSVAYDFVVAFPAGTTVYTGKYYVPSSGSAYYSSNVFLITGTAPSWEGPGLIMQNISSATCTGACVLSNQL